MLRTTSTKYIDQAIKNGYSVWYIGNSPKQIKNGKVIIKSELAPSNSYAKQVNEIKTAGMSEEEAIHVLHKKYLIEKIKSREFKKSLNELYVRGKRKENIILVSDEDETEKSHRCVVLGLLQALQVECQGPDYSAYWLLYKQIENSE